MTEAVAEIKRGSFSPLYAALAIAVVFLLVLLGWRLIFGGEEAGDQKRKVAAGGDEVEWEIKDLEPLPKADPLNIWPRNNMKLTWPVVWVMWTCAEPARCRLLGSKDEQLWFNFGRTVGYDSILPLDMSKLDSRARGSFCIEFEREGVNYRSYPRAISYVKGACFSQRKYEFELDGSDPQTFMIKVLDRDLSIITRKDLRTEFGGVAIGIPQTLPESDKNEFPLMLYGGKDLPKEGIAGWIEIHDPVTDAYDRAIVRIKRK